MYIASGLDGFYVGRYWGSSKKKLQHYRIICRKYTVVDKRILPKYCLMPIVKGDLKQDVVYRDPILQQQGMETLTSLASWPYKK